MRAIVTNYLCVRKHVHDITCRTPHIRASVGITGDSYDNALAETVNGLYKLEVIKYLKSDWAGLADVELATLNWVDWFNKKRLHSAIGYVSPFQFEAMYYEKMQPSDQAA